MLGRVVRAGLLLSAAALWLWAAPMCAQTLERYKPCPSAPLLIKDIRDPDQPVVRRVDTGPLPQERQNIFISEVRFAHATLLPGPARDKAVADLRRKEFIADSNWIHEALELLRGAWQDHGYYKAEVKGEAQLVASNDPRRQLAILTVRVDEGRQYRLDKIRVTNATAFPAEALRALVPLQDGDIFSVEKIRKGLESINRRYSEFGYIDVTSRPMTEADEERQRITLEIVMDEQPQYRVGKVEVLGATPELERRLRAKLAEGDVYNNRRFEDFFAENKALLPPTVRETNVEVRRDVKKGLLFLRFDLRACLPLDKFFADPPKP
jgi:outer membrane translocation and assembly module TamA